MPTSEDSNAVGPSTAISNAVTACLQSFLAVEGLDDTHEAARIISDQAADNFSRFKIWAGSTHTLCEQHDPTTGELGFSEVDEVSQRIRELLADLLEANQDIYVIASGQQANRIVEAKECDQEDPISSHEEAGTRSEILEVALSAGDIITEMFRITSLLHQVTRGDRYPQPTRSVGALFPSEIDIQHVSDAFPKVRQRPWLLERLGRAIAERRQLLYRTRVDRRRIPTSPQRSSTVGDVASQHAKPTHVKLAPGNVSKTKSTFGDLDTFILNPEPAEMTAMASQSLNIVRGYGPDTSSIEDNIPPLSNRTDQEAHFEIMALDRITKEGGSFECPFCCDSVSFSEDESWRRHVVRDLRAYICTFESCSAGLFADREAWFGHELEHHRRQWICQSCRTASFDTAVALVDHLGTTHEISLSNNEALATAFIEASSRPVLQIDASDCPLCDTWCRELNAIAKARGLKEENASKVSVTDFERHLGVHQEHIALHATMSVSTERASSRLDTNVDSAVVTSGTVSLKPSAEPKFPQADIKAGLSRTASSEVTPKSFKDREAPQLWGALLSSRRSSLEVNPSDQRNTGQGLPPKPAYVEECDSDGNPVNSTRVYARRRALSVKPEVVARRYPRVHGYPPDDRQSNTPRRSASISQAIPACRDLDCGHSRCQNARNSARRFKMPQEERSANEAAGEQRPALGQVYSRPNVTRPPVTAHTTRAQPTSLYGYVPVSYAAMQHGPPPSPSAYYSRSYHPPYPPSAPSRVAAPPISSRAYSQSLLDAHPPRSPPYTPPPGPVISVRASEPLLPSSTTYNYLESSAHPRSRRTIPSRDHRPSAFADSDSSGSSSESDAVEDDSDSYTYGRRREARQREDKDRMPPPSPPSRRMRRRQTSSASYDSTGPDSRNRPTVITARTDSLYSSRSRRQSTTASSNSTTGSSTRSSARSAASVRTTASSARTSVTSASERSERVSIEDRNGPRSTYLSREARDQLIRQYEQQKKEQEDLRERIRAYQESVGGRQNMELTAANIKRMTETKDRSSGKNTTDRSAVSGQSSQPPEADGIRIETGGTVLHVYGSADVDVQRDEQGESARLIIGKTGRESSYSGISSDGTAKRRQRLGRSRSDIKVKSMRERGDDGYEEML